MSRKKLFIENIFAYGFINLFSKLVPFLLLPVITRMLPNASDYGVFNMYTLIIGFGTPLAILGIYDAMFREYFEKDDEQYKYDVIVTGHRIVLIASFIISTLCIMLSKEISLLFLGEATYNDIIIWAGIGIFISANKSPVQVPARMENQKRQFLFSGFLSALANYGIALLLIYYGFSYFGLILSSIMAEIFLVLYFVFNSRKYLLKGHFKRSIAQELFKVGIPLLPTFLIYWIYNSVDRLMIANMLGTVELGVYSIGAKIAQVSQLIYAGFAGGFAYFKYKTMNDHDQVIMNSRLFEYLGVFSFCSFVAFLPLAKTIFELIFEGEYVRGYIVTPYLFLSPLLLMLFQVVGTQFIVMKRSYISSSALLIGALFNVFLNYCLINSLGIEGAAIATLLGYIFSVVSVTFIAHMNHLVVISKRFLIVFALTVANAMLYKLFLHTSLLISLVSSGIFGVIVVCYYRDEATRIISKLDYKKK